MWHHHYVQSQLGLVWQLCLYPLKLPVEAPSTPTLARGGAEQAATSTSTLPALPTAGVSLSPLPVPSTDFRYRTLTGAKMWLVGWGSTEVDISNVNYSNDSLWFIQIIQMLIIAWLYILKSFQGTQISIWWWCDIQLCWVLSSNT